MNSLRNATSLQPLLPLRDRALGQTLKGRDVDNITPTALNALATLAHSLEDTDSFLCAPPILVLVADDCPFQQLLACALLSQWGILPQLASDGREAVSLATEHVFDIILMDLDMPGMDGLTATRRLRAHEVANGMFRPVPVVAYTTASSTDSRQWQAAGMSALLPKPSNILAMGECFERWCPRKFAASEQGGVRGSRRLTRPSEKHRIDA